MFYLKISEALLRLSSLSATKPTTVRRGSGRRGHRHSQGWGQTCGEPAPAPRLVRVHIWHKCAPSDTCVCILGPSHSPPWVWTSCWECLRHRRVTFRSLLTLCFHGEACDARPRLARAVRAEARPCPVRRLRPLGTGPGQAPPAPVFNAGTTGCSTVSRHWPNG